MTAIRYRVQRRGGRLQPWRVQRSDPITGGVTVATLASWTAAMRYVDTELLMASVLEVTA